MMSTTSRAETGSTFAHRADAGRSPGRRRATLAMPMDTRRHLQALTGAQLSRAQEWREWWNENKKRTDW